MVASRGPYHCLIPSLQDALLRARGQLASMVRSRFEVKLTCSNAAAVCVCLWRCGALTLMTPFVLSAVAHASFSIVMCLPCSRSKFLDGHPSSRTDKLLEYLREAQENVANGGTGFVAAYHTAPATMP